MPRRTTVLSAAALLVTATGFAPTDATLGAGGEGVLASTGSVGPIEHVEQIEYEDAYGTGPNQGTDLEFATIEVEREPGRPGKRSDHAGGRGRGGGDGQPPGLTEERTFAFAGSYDNGLHIIDVTEPGEPEVVAVYDCGISQGDVQVFERDEGWFATYTHDTGYSVPSEDGTTCQREAEELGFEPGTGTYIIDVTDPTRPELASHVPVEKGSHNQTVHPSGDYLYNSNSALIDSVLGSPGIEVYDIADIHDPDQEPSGFLELPVRPGLGTESHDITFNPEGDRAYSAALSQTVIIDTEDPLAPELVSSFVDPAINVEHQSDPVTIEDPILGERDFLVVEDEVAGATPTGQCPNGGVHVYDVTGELEEDPQKVGYWNIDDLGPTEDGLGRCTAHVFELHEEEQLMVIAYYNGGVRVVDISGLVGVALGEQGVGMRELAAYRFEDSDTWAVKAPEVDRDGAFHIYGNDQARGFDVFEVDLSGGEADDATAGTGADVWLSPAQLDARMERLGTPDLDLGPGADRADLAAAFGTSEDALTTCLIPPDA